MATQRKALADGRIHSWEVDLDTLRRVSPWAERDPRRLDRELEELGEHFPTWLTTVGRRLDDAGWPFAGVVSCERCGELLVPDRGLRCVSCDQTRDPEGLLIGFAGRLPALASDRPLLEGFRRRCQSLRDRGKERRARSFEAYFLSVKDAIFFAPPVWAFCPATFPDGEPMVMVRPEYFEVLGIPADHIYPGTRWRLCNYANWHAVTVRTMLQQRIVPRIYLDLMVADLVAAGALERVLEDLNLSLHRLYNVAGRGEASQRFRTLYEQALAR